MIGVGIGASFFVGRSEACALAADSTPAATMTVIRIRLIGLPVACDRVALNRSYSLAAVLFGDFGSR
jgi:hypothetical protein